MMSYTCFGLTIDVNNFMHVERCQPTQHAFLVNINVTLTSHRNKGKNNE